MARPGYSVKELSAILDIHPGSVTASLDPGLRKVARLLVNDPIRFFATLQPFLAEERERLADLSFNQELPARILMQTGRLDRFDLAKSNGNSTKTR